MDLIYLIFRNLCLSTLVLRTQTPCSSSLLTFVNTRDQCSRCAAHTNW